MPTITLEPTKDNDVLATYVLDHCRTNHNRQGITVESCCYTTDREACAADDVSGVCPSILCGARTFVQFLVEIPAGNVLTKAILKFWVRDSTRFGTMNGYPRTYIISRVTENWEELGITWVNQPPVTKENEVSQLVEAVPSTFDAFDVTRLVQDALKVGNIIGLRVIDAFEYNSPGAIWVIWGSKEGAVTGYVPYPPQLEVTYESAVKGSLEVHAYAG